jgi:N-glycosylase/DNA lyase
MITFENIKDFDLDHIFDCGQCFRWDKQTDGSYSGLAEGVSPVNISFHQSDSRGHSKIVIESNDKASGEEFWRRYLDLDRDYGKIKADLSEGDPVMAKAASFGQGIRILKQDKWETVVSFIISQNNNIRRIKGCISSLCKEFGKPAGKLGTQEYNAIPGAEVLASLTEGDLAVCRLGYRARYLIETAKAVYADGGKTLAGLEPAETDDAFRYLTSLCGVGSKVANCIMLFSLGKYDSFPVDVWVRQAMSKLYGIDKDDIKAMKEYASRNFGQYGGIAQQYLFYYIRSQKGD